MELTSCMPEHWTKDQISIWNNFENHWQQLLDGNIEEFLSYIHSDFIGYGHESPLPVDKPWLEKWVGFWANTTKFAICELRPINVKIHGDIAILQVIIFTIEKTSGGQGVRAMRRYTMTWEKAKDKWLVIGSHNNLVQGY